jgi:hypothetical protein
MIVGGIILLLTGVFVPSFVGNEILISGLRGEKKLAEKTEAEVRAEARAVRNIDQDVREIFLRLSEIEKKIDSLK